MPSGACGTCDASALRELVFATARGDVRDTAEEENESATGCTWVEFGDAMRRGAPSWGAATRTVPPVCLLALAPRATVGARLTSATARTAPPAPGRRFGCGSDEEHAQREGENNDEAFHEWGPRVVLTSETITCVHLMG